MTVVEQQRATNGKARNGDGKQPGRVPPHDLEIERALLETILLSKDALDTATGLGVGAEHFHSPNHGHIYDAALRLHAAGDPVDHTTVAAELRRGGQDDAARVVTDLYGVAGAVGNAARYARTIVDLKLLRSLIGVAGEIAEIGYDQPHDVAAAIDRAETLVFALLERTASRRADPTSSRDGITRYLDHLTTLYERGDALTGIATGYHDLDHLTLGLHHGDLVVVGARPAMGKTAWSLGAADHIAGDGTPVLFVSIEMSLLQLQQRRVAAVAQVDAQRLRSGQLADNDWRRINDHIATLADRPLWVVDDPTATVGSIRTAVRQLVRTLADRPVVIVDYLQLMTGRGKAENRQVEVSEMSRGLKVLAREFEVPVVALSQLSRNLEYRADKRPVLADLRESGSIEQDADAVLFLYRDEVYNPDSSERGTAEIIVAKQRNGPTGMARVAWLPQFTRFSNMARGVVPDDRRTGS